MAQGLLVLLQPWHLLLLHLALQPLLWQPVQSDSGSAVPEPRPATDREDKQL